MTRFNKGTFTRTTELKIATGERAVAVCISGETGHPTGTAVETRFYPDGRIEVYVHNEEMCNRPGSEVNGCMPVWSSDSELSRPLDRAARDLTGDDFLKTLEAIFGEGKVIRLE